jgi:RimJ/RimL family protein N-acetyltransferase
MSEDRSPVYRIQTPRLQIRCYQPTDAAALKAAIDANLDHLRPWMPWAHDEPTTLATKVSFLRRTRGRFDLDVDLMYGVFDPKGLQVLGGSGLHDRVGDRAREIGYWIHHEQGGKGLATEVAAALTKVGFEIMGLERIEIHCDPANHASARVAEKLGYTLEVIRRKVDRDVKGNPRNQMLFTMLAEEFPTSPFADIALESFDVAGERLG